MNPLLIAKQGIGSGVLAMALMGFVSVSLPVVQLPDPVEQGHSGGSGGFVGLSGGRNGRSHVSRYYNSDLKQYIIPIDPDLELEEADEELVILNVLMEIALNEL